MCFMCASTYHSPHIHPIPLRIVRVYQHAQQCPGRNKGFRIAAHPVAGVVISLLRIGIDPKTFDGVAAFARALSARKPSLYFAAIGLQPVAQAPFAFEPDQAADANPAMGAQKQEGYQNNGHAALFQNHFFRVGGVVPKHQLVADLIGVDVGIDIGPINGLLASLGDEFDHGRDGGTAFGSRMLQFDHRAGRFFAVLHHLVAVVPEITGNGAAGEARQCKNAKKKVAEKTVLHVLKNLGTKGAI